VQAKVLPCETVTVLEQLIGSDYAPIGRGGQFTMSYHQLDEFIV
jgi:hypothetical protein